MAKKNNQTGEAGGAGDLAEQLKAVSADLHMVQTELDEATAALAQAKTELEIREGAIASLERQLAAAKPALAPASVTGGKPPAPPPGARSVKVTGPKAGRFRIGRRFNAEPVTIAVSAEELERLKADKKLSVAEL